MGKGGGACYLKSILRNIEEKKGFKNKHTLALSGQKNAQFFKTISHNQSSYCIGLHIRSILLFVFHFK